MKEICCGSLGDCGVILIHCTNPKEGIFFWHNIMMQFSFNMVQDCCGIHQAMHATTVTEDSSSSSVHRLAMVYYISQALYHRVKQLSKEHLLLALEQLNDGEH